MLSWASLKCQHYPILPYFLDHNIHTFQIAFTRKAKVVMYWRIWCSLIISWEAWQNSKYSHWATGWIIQGLNHSRDKRFFSSPKRQDQVWDWPNLLSVGTDRSSQRVQQPGPKADHTPPSSVRFNIEWNLRPLHPYVFMVCTETALPCVINLINFIFIFFLIKRHWCFPCILVVKMNSFSCEEAGRVVM